jgi:hypothetical protein
MLLLQDVIVGYCCDKGSTAPRAGPPRAVLTESGLAIKRRHSPRISGLELHTATCLLQSPQTSCCPDVLTPTCCCCRTDTDVAIADDTYVPDDAVAAAAWATSGG